MSIVLRIIFVAALFAAMAAAPGYAAAQEPARAQAATEKELKGLDPSKVCMVQNRTSAAMKMIPVEVDGRRYYGCCQGCVGRLKFDRSVRFAKDPSTGKEVDKSEAFIVQKEDGGVQYFESEETAKRFLSRKSL